MEGGTSKNEKSRGETEEAKEDQGFPPKVNKLEVRKLLTLPLMEPKVSTFYWIWEYKFHHDLPKKKTPTNKERKGHEGEKERK